MRQRRIRLDTYPVVLILAIVIALHVHAAGWSGDAAALTLRAVYTSGAAEGTALEIALFRWPTDAERAPLLAALSAPPTSPPEPPAPPPAGRAGRGGRGGRGPAPPLSPMARLEAAIKAAPTCGYIWGEGVTGYSIKYAWQSPLSEGTGRIILIADRRVGASLGSSGLTPVNPTDGDFTLIEVRLDNKGAGEAKASHTSVALDTAARTLALDNYTAAPTLFTVTR